VYCVHEGALAPSNEVVGRFVIVLHV
jgi:hypothetical protein